MQEVKKSTKKDKIKNHHSLIVWNDDFNTFEHVINCLVKYCGHSQDQATQCTYTIHYKGRCEVKKGDKEKLQIMANYLKFEKITSSVE